MNSNQLIFQPLFLILVIFGCNNLDKENIENSEQEVARLDKSDWEEFFISIDSIDFVKYPNLMELKAWITDTITASGWKIEYFVKNDETIEQDIYIRIRKNGFVNIYKGEYLLEVRRYFIPTYLCETESKIIMEHGCATDCSAITLISKADSNLIEEYTHVIDFNENRKILIHLTDSSYLNENKLFQIELVDLNSGIKSNINLKNICSAIYKPSCIDTIIYKADEVEIVTSLRENIEKTEFEKKKSLVKL